MDNRDPRRRVPAAPAPIETVATATAIIDFLAESDAPMGVQQIAEVLGLTKSRASRHLANLETLGLVARGESGRGFRLGWRIDRWGQIAASRMPLPELLHGPLARLNERIAHTVLLCAAAGGDAIVLKCLPARTAIRIDVDPGLVLSLPHSPTARVCHAFQPQERRRALLDDMQQREPGFRIDDLAHFQRQIAAIQASHFAWDDNKFDAGHGALAAPVFNREGALAAVITVMTPSHELANGPALALVTALIECAEQCSRLLGGRHQYPRP